MASGGRQGAGEMGGEVAAFRAAAPTVSIARLPQTTTRLFGRDADLAWLEACWAEGAHVATIVAWGGVGKSALVNAWLARLRDGGWGGAARVYGWSFYSQGTDRQTSADAFIEEALRWFGDADPRAGSPWDKGERLASLVRRDRALLVLDGVEPLQWGPGPEVGRIKDPALAALVRELGAQNAGLCVMTSRVDVADLEGLAGEKVRALKLDHLGPESGAELLDARGAKGAAEELRAASVEYGGHCLALTLLGSYLRKAHHGDIRARGEIPPLLGDKYAQRLMAVYERWFEGKPELGILWMLGLFDRPATAEEIAALRKEPVIVGLTDALVNVGTSAWNEAITTLHDVGLLAASMKGDETEELDAHPLVREYFGEQVRKEQSEVWREGHQRLYRHLRHKPTRFPNTVTEMEPLYAAAVHGCKAGQHREALEEVYWKRIQRGNQSFNTNKLGAFGSELTVLAAFFDRCWDRPASELDERWKSLVLNQVGLALRGFGRLSEAANVLRLGLEKRIALAAWAAAATTASNLSQVLLSRGQLDEALVAAHRSVELVDKSDDVFDGMAHRTMLAMVLHAKGSQLAAAEQYEEAERRQRLLEPAYPKLYAARGFGYCDLLLEQGRYAEVRERAARALEWAKKPGGLLANAVEKLSLGRSYSLAAEHDAEGEPAKAATYLNEAIEGLRGAGYQEYLPLGLLARADLYIHTGDFLRARADLDETLSLSTRCGFRLHEADAYLGYGRLHLAEGHSAEAREHFVLASKIIQATGYHRRDKELAHLEAEVAAMPPAAPLPPTTRPTDRPKDLNIDPVRVHHVKEPAIVNQISHLRPDGDPTQRETMTQTLDDLIKLLPAQFDLLLAQLAVPPAYLSGPQAPQATRSTELIRWAEQQHRIVDLDRVLAKLLGRATAVEHASAAGPAAGPAPSAPASVDVGIVVALQEELRTFLALTESYTPHPDDDLDAYLFTRSGYRCAVILVGEMGETQAGMFTERLISALDPGILVSIGIAGGVHDDLHAGDVHIPSQAVQYLQDGKASPAQGGGFAVVPGAPAYRADFALRKAVRSFEFKHPAQYEKWIADGGADLAVLLPDAGQRDGLVAGKVVRSKVRVLADGHVATGPVVGAAPAFSAWIRTHDRNVKSLEMESAAVLLAAQTRSQPKRALAIRGISDKGDADKKKLDELEDGVLRRYAMRNAVRLLWALLDAKALPLGPR